MISLVCPPAFARDVVLSTIEDVRAAVDAREVRSVDDIWARLTPEMHLAPALTFGGLATAPSSPRFPRILLATDDARLFATATTKRRDPAYRQIEFAAADPRTDELSLYLIDFRRRPVIERNPRECMGCHSVDGIVRLRVEGYPHWPGWFGTMGRHDTMFDSDLNDQELAAIKTFMSRPPPPRLRRPYRDGFQMTDDVHVTATRFTALAILAEARMAARALAADPDFARLRPALATTEFPREFAAALDPDLRAEFTDASVGLAKRLGHDQAEYERVITAEFTARGERRKRTFGGQPQIFALPYEFALNRVGSSLARYSTSLAPGAINVNSGVGGWLSSYVSQIVGDDLARDLGLPARDEDLDYVTESGLRLPTVRPRGDEFTAALRARACATDLTSTAVRRGRRPK